MTTAAFHTPVLETDRLVLRAPRASDVPAMLRFFGSDRARFYGGPLSAAEGWRRFATYAGQWMLRGYGFFAVTARKTGDTLGLAGPYHPEDFPEPEMSWLLTDAAHEGHGYASEAVECALEHVFSHHGWTRVVSYIDPENAASRALALRLGAARDEKAIVPMPGCEAFRHYPGGKRQ